MLLRPFRMKLRCRLLYPRDERRRRFEVGEPQNSPLPGKAVSIMLIRGHTVIGERYLRSMVMLLSTMSGHSGDEVLPWYRYNIFFYVEQTKLAQFPSAIADTMVNEAADLKDISPISYKLRKSILRLRPYSTINLAARIRAQNFS